MILRDYQQAAIDCTFNWISVNPGNPVIVIPTGGGKSLIMAQMARDVVEKWGGRVGIVAHTQELVEQNYAKLKQLWPEAPAGIYAAGLKRKDRFEKIICIQIQSAANKTHELGKFDLLLVDEGHRVPLKDEGMYRRFFEGCKRFSPNLRPVCCTATAYRLEGKAIPICGPDYIFNAIAYEIGVAELIDRGFLSRLISKRGASSIDASKVKKSGGDYVERELAKLVDVPEIVKEACAEIIALSPGRKAIIVFCVTIEHAEHVRDALRAMGETAEMLHGKTPKAERKDIIARHQRGEYRIIVNVNVLSEGYDAPHIDCVAMLRATMSPGLYAQQVGRGLRMSPGKSDCLVLDFANNITTHGPLDQIKVSKGKNGKPGEVQTGLVKACHQCDVLVPLSVSTCPECGYEFPPVTRDVTHLTSPTGAAILSADVAPDWQTVRAVEYSEHVGASGIPTMKVTYVYGLHQTVREFICLEHQGFAYTIALAWWRKRAIRADIKAPTLIAEAVEKANAGELKTPLRILLRTGQKYPEIIDYEFEPSALNSPQGNGNDVRPAASDRPTQASTNDHTLRGMHALLARIKPVQQTPSASAD